MANQPKVVIVDSSPFFCDSITACLQNAGYHVTPVCDTAALVDQPPFDIHETTTLIIGPCLPTHEGFAVCRWARDLPDAHIKVVFISTHAAEPDFQEDVAYVRAAAYTPATASCGEVVDVLAHVIAGRSWIPQHVLERALRPIHLSRRERDVLKLMAHGDMDKEIAAALHLSQNTVHTHVNDIIHKLDKHDRQAAVHSARHRDWCS